jgi:excisionase family DNA binding protein
MGEWVTVKQAAQILSCHISYIYKLAYQERVKSRKEGRLRYVLTSDLARFVEQRERWKRQEMAGREVPQPFAMLDVSEVTTIAGKPDLLLLRHDIFMLKQTIENLISHIQNSTQSL